MDLFGYLGVGLGENCYCRCVILYVSMLGWFYGICYSDSLSLFFGNNFPRRGSRVLLSVCVRRIGAFVMKIIIIFINCNCVDTRWPWLFYRYTKYEIRY